MKKYLYDYISEVDNLIKKSKKITDKEIQNHLNKISFFQHERLVHLIVTVFYTVVFLIFTALSFVHLIFLIAMFILLIFVVCYIIHYFHLENGVQYLYKQYDELINKSK